MKVIKFIDENGAVMFKEPDFNVMSSKYDCTTFVEEMDIKEFALDNNQVE